MSTAKLTIDGHNPSYQFIRSHTGRMSCWGVITHMEWWRAPSSGKLQFFAKIGPGDGFIHANDVIIDYCPKFTSEAERIVLIPTPEGDEILRRAWCQSCEEITLHIQDPRDGWWRCATEGCEADSKELTPE